jgi:single-strand DNA-binding protein
MLIGNLGRDPEIQFLEGGTALARFPLATTERYKDRGGMVVERTEWHTIVLWRGLAELAHKLLHKGSYIYIEGRIRTRQWQDKEGNTRYTTEIVAENFTMLEKRGYGNGTHEVPAANAPDEHGGEIPVTQEQGDDLPF